MVSSAVRAKVEGEGVSEGGEASVAGSSDTVVGGGGVDGETTTGEGDAGSEDKGTPRISARAAGEELASRFECKCFCRDLPMQSA